MFSKVLKISASVAIVGAVSYALFFPETQAQNQDLTAPDHVRFALYSMPSVYSVSNHADISVFSLLQSVHMGLLRADYKGSLFSAAAKDWVVSEDGTSYTFTIDTSLKFHDGRNLTCKDVEQTFVRLQHYGTQGFWRDTFRSIDCISNNEIKMVLKQPSTVFLPTLAYFEAAILPADLPSMLSTTIGLGPYRFVEHDPAIGGGPALYQVENHPLIHSFSPKKVSFKSFSSVKAASEAFSNHEVDIVPLRGIDDPRFAKNTAESLGYSRIWFLDFGDLALKRLSREDRRCLSQRIDRKAVASAVSANRPGLMVAAYGVIQPQSSGTVRSIDEHAPCERKANRTSIEVIYSAGLVSSAYLEALTQTLEEVGYEVKYNPMPKSALIERMAKRNYDVVLSSYGLEVSAEFSLRAFYSRYSAVPFLPVSARNYESELESIEASVTESERSNKIIAFQKAMTTYSYLIPITFERATFLVRDCLDIQNLNSKISVEDFQEIGGYRSCSEK